MMSNRQSELPKGADVTIVLSLEKLLSRLETDELDKPPGKRREIPSIPELAEAAGVHRVTMYNLVKGKVKQVNLELLSAIMSELRKRGFEVEVADMLTAFPAEEVEA